MYGLGCCVIRLKFQNRAKNVALAEPEQNQRVMQPILFYSACLVVYTNVDVSACWYFLVLTIN